MEKRVRVLGQAALLWQSANPLGQVGVILLHPHPHMGGDMNNPIVEDGSEGLGGCWLFLRRSGSRRIAAQSRVGASYECGAAGATPFHAAELLAGTFEAFACSRARFGSDRRHT
ncbi:unnamed protein product [Symbiodinium microadriaticum]|nr:unnamed protein product [Symbiodinium microadriaticum]